MNKAYQLPHDQPNPFADTEQTPGAAGDSASPYAAGAIPAASVDLGAQTYQATLTPRPAWLVSVSDVSLALALLALLATILFMLPWGIFTLALGVYGWWMARHDLHAMRYGAMEPSRRLTAQLALGLAIAGTVTSLLSIVVSVARFWMLGV
jgi:hypothetical protein